MSLSFLIEETVNEGLDKLQKRVSEDMERILNEIAYAATGRYEDETAPIPRLMSTDWNPYLFMSGQVDSGRTFEISDDKAEIHINYSGLRYYEEYTDEEFMPWWEFSENQEANPAERILERDYAFYQETGIDPIASPKHAKHKHAIEWGLLYASPEIRKETIRQWELMMQRI